MSSPEGTAAAAPEAEAKTKGPVRIQGYATVEEDARIRNAWAAVSTPSKYPNLSHFVVDAVLQRVAELEEELNGGKPFPTPPGGRPGSRRGRPTSI